MLVYHHDYAMGAPGIDRLHPFDGYRPRKAMYDLKARWGSVLPLQAPPAACSDEQLLVAHDESYLRQLRTSRAVAAVIELPLLGLLPRPVLEWMLLRPMRWATAGTLLAARLALQRGCGINLSGGFHHAKRSSGEGFCVYADVAYAVQALRAEGKARRVVYIDVDAHQGNGVSSWFADDADFAILDVFNADIYPKEDVAARARVDVPIALPNGAGGDVYLEALRRELPAFLDRGADLVVLNAGSDVLASDPLGGLRLSLEQVAERDRFLAEQVKQRGLPLVFVPSGGYSADSRVALAEGASILLEVFGGTAF